MKNAARASLLALFMDNQLMDVALRTNVMISALELRHIIECGFLPLSCACTTNPDGSLMIKVIEPSSGSVELLVTGVSVTGLTSSREIANLIGELRTEMSARQISFSSAEGRA
ncbi:DUF1652 domain-containing protein [Pseudomonas frederiksbergensis]|uniref:DUF1652 domain-containing protein n=1 Tax=Pseudomonas frederiksbergensis TaxID=104087 RepID=UPI0035CCDB6E